jgi:hypothetical protein
MAKVQGKTLPKFIGSFGLSFDRNGWVKNQFQILDLINGWVIVVLHSWFDGRPTVLWRYRFDEIFIESKFRLFAFDDEWRNTADEMNEERRKTDIAKTKKQLEAKKKT